MAKSNLMPDEGIYVALLDDLKARIRAAQLKAALAVNQELLLLYWQIGQEILSRQQKEGWGAGVISRLSRDLKQEFPEMKGFSARNLGYMKALADAWPNELILQEVLAKIPWYHNITLLEKLKDPEERLWYAQKVIEHGWSRSILVGQIENSLYQEQKGLVTNFERTLPKLQSDLAHQLIKDPYHLDFLVVEANIQHQDLKRYLVAHMREFLLELGVGFSFVKHNYPISIGGQDFCIDMLFYHLKLRCFIAIQLEMDEFKPEQSGRMNFYLSAIDDAERGEYDQPTIGIILCKTKDRTIAEYSLRNLQNPIAVAEHRLPKVLPSAERLQSELENAVQMIEGGSEILEVKAQPDEATTVEPTVASEKLTEVAVEIQRLLKLLEESNPMATDAERKTFVSLAVPAALRRQAADALRSGSEATVGQSLEASYVDVVIAVIESWQRAD